MKTNKREVPKKNYVIVLLILIAVVIVTFYIKRAYDLNAVNRLSQSVLSRIVGEIKYEEIDSVFLEASEDYFVYIGYLGNEEIYNFEKKLKNIVIDNSIQDHFYYINLTEEMDQENFMTELNNKFNINNKIKSLPTLLYFEDGNFKDIITSDENIIDIEEMEEMIKKYSQEVSE